MANVDPNHLIRLCDAYAEHTGLSHWRISAKARDPENGKGDGGFFKRLRTKVRRNGQPATVEVTTYNSVMQWFWDNWPKDLPWPEEIDRPRGSNTLKEAS
ncbi:MAG: hypothetical protein AAFS03_02425 [Pseudomonadota bacterium]